MKKIILAVIILAAAGGITYYLLQKKKTDHQLTINKNLLPGKWQVDSLIAQKDSTKDGLVLLMFEMDSSFRNQVYEVKTDGEVIISNPFDSLVKKDTSFFAWGRDREFIWNQKTTDTAADTMTIVKLDKKDFVLQTADSTLIYLRKVK